MQYTPEGPLLEPSCGPSPHANQQKNTAFLLCAAAFVIGRSAAKTATWRLHLLVLCAFLFLVSFLLGMTPFSTKVAGDGCHFFPPQPYQVVVASLVSYPHPARGLNALLYMLYIHVAAQTPSVGFVSQSLTSPLVALTGTVTVAASTPSSLPFSAIDMSCSAAAVTTSVAAIKCSLFVRLLFVHEEQVQGARNRTYGRRDKQEVGVITMENSRYVGRCGKLNSSYTAGGGKTCGPRARSQSKTPR